MTIVWARTDPHPRSRDLVLARLEGIPDVHCIDVGGAMDMWADSFVDTYVDALHIGTSKKQFTGDINNQEVWDQIEADAKQNGQWDFSICSHTLEDIRDPVFVIQKLQKISKAGYIAMPSKHTELANIQSHAYKGYCHHRWIFTMRDATLVALAKWPMLSALEQRSFGWWKPELVHTELGILWTDSIDCQYAKGDFPGWSCEELAKQYSQELAEGI